MKVGMKVDMKVGMMKVGMMKVGMKIGRKES